MFKHILFPTDTSAMSNGGFQAAVNLAKTYGGKITVLNIHEEFLNKSEMQFLRISPQSYQDYMAERATASRKIIDEMITAENAGEMCTVLLREGSPRERITQVAEEIDADVIVMKSKGRTNLKEAFLGSVAEHVVHVSTVPVLVLK